MDVGRYLRTVNAKLAEARVRTRAATFHTWAREYTRARCSNKRSRRLSGAVFSGSLGPDVAPAVDPS